VKIWREFAAGRSNFRRIDPVEDLIAVAGREIRRSLAQCRNGCAGVHSRGLEPEEGGGQPCHERLLNIEIQSGRAV